MNKQVPPLARRGLTLVEVLIATVLLVAVLAPMLGMFTTAARGYTRGGQETITLNLARRHLETCLARGYDRLDDCPEDNGSWQPCPDYAGYEYQLTITDYIADDPVLEVKEVIVRVRPAGYPAGEVQLATLVARWP